MASRGTFRIKKGDTVVVIAGARQSRGGDRGKTGKVLSVNHETNRVVVGPKRALAVRAAAVEAVNWLAEDQSAVHAKVRSLAPPKPGTWDGACFIFDTPEFGVAPGQSAVFYDGERLLGGGTIAATQAAQMEPA